ncbi:hypothetical protein F53441_10296 [Fusarium austroafricanum]|uniref:Uncharacterized protein n=1 Tax=Fusarium austroafricanum TaxID=2364996 RepID=A0A8H4KAQ2_9HYPO|nr:hypothetical protein F53441_10296 [Fusarium austroafricanum]
MKPFNDREKRHLLAEMIKHSQIDVRILASLVLSRQVEPNWMQMQLPNGRNMDQCMQTAQSMDIGQRGTKRKASEEGPSNNNVQPYSPQQLPPLAQSPTTQSSLANIQRQPAMPPDPQSQQSEQSEQPPKKKKGRPAYAGRDVTSHRPFPPRLIAPRPPTQILRNPYPNFRSIAPARQTVLPSLSPESFPTIQRGMSRALAVEFHNAPSHFNPQKSAVTTSRIDLQNQLTRVPNSLPPGEEVPNRTRSLSEAMPRAEKKEASQTNRSSSLQPLGTNNQTRPAEGLTPDQTQQTTMGSGNKEH